MHPFVWFELMIYFLPILLVWLIQRYFRDYLKFFPDWPLSLAQVLIPFWLVLIYELGWLLYDLNVLPFVFFYTAFLLGLQLYDYIRRIDHFSFRHYYKPASELFFTILSCFLFSMMLLRLITYVF
ncbi:hypothetical protein [Vaginisenegalia massiliensis]|uniref:hypothetical protein n=1 Tax=Vaginisenegalia massiliensis TaxID=2058294 RepID=UPI000F54BA87|nr:hypothetical protein [Vaginisenegalia massiliensis]